MLHHPSLGCSHIMQICILVGFVSFFFFFTSATYKLAIHELRFTQFRETGMSGFSTSTCIHSGELELINRSCYSVQESIETATIMPKGYSDDLASSHVSTYGNGKSCEMRRILQELRDVTLKNKIQDVFTWHSEQKFIPVRQHGFEPTLENTHERQSISPSDLVC